MLDTANQILDNLNSAVLLFNAQLILKYINPAGEIIFALSANNLLGRHIEQLLHCAPGSSCNYLCLAIEANRPITQRGIVLILADEQEITVDCSAIPITNRNGNKFLLLEIQRIDLQLRITKENQLVTQQQLTAAVVRNLAHEINNPLGGLRGAAQLLQMELQDAALHEYTQIIISEADRLQELVIRLLGPKKRPEIKKLNIHQLLERVRQLIQAENRQRISIKQDYDPSIPEIQVDPDLIIQALLNIARNAARAAGEQGIIRFRTRIQRQYTIINKLHRLVVQVDIQDNGPGIPLEIQEKIFCPMVSGEKEGMGLGLSIAQSVINQHGGLIEYQSCPGETIFSLLLPLEYPHV
jgi:two-component system, NtrC family, nitrogen regulation sensor histidine kinase GlnL